MKVLILGGTGSIGTAITHEMVGAGHTVQVLCRSDTAASKVTGMGGTPLYGTLRTPEHWQDALADQDVLIHAAITFDDTMGHVDTRITDTLLAHANRSPGLRVIYTGGCWLFGATGDRVADDTAPFDPLPAFDWAQGNAGRLQDCPDLSTAVIHPAMVYEAAGGVFTRAIDAARNGQPIEIYGSADTRWPLIHRSDLARAYRLLAENPDLTGHFTASAETGVRVGDIAAEIRARVGGSAPVVVPPGDVLAKHAPIGAGYMLDQQMAAPRLRALGWEPQHTDYRAFLA